MAPEKVQQLGLRSREKVSVWTQNPHKETKTKAPHPAASRDRGAGTGWLLNRIDSVSSPRDEPLLTHWGPDLPGEVASTP